MELGADVCCYAASCWPKVQIYPHIPKLSRTSSMLVYYYTGIQAGNVHLSSISKKRDQMGSMDLKASERVCRKAPTKALHAKHRSPQHSKHRQPQAMARNGGG